MIKKFISQAGTHIEVGDFYGGGNDEVVSTLEEITENDVTHLRINTTLSFYDLSLNAGDYLGMEDGSGKIVKSKHDVNNDNL